MWQVRWVDINNCLPHQNQYDMDTILLQQLVQVQQLSAALRGRAVSGGGGGGRGSSAPPSSSTLVAQALASAESAAVSELRAQLSAVQSELATREEQYELSLRSYQQQYERLKLQYEVWRGQGGAILGGKGGSLQARPG